MALFETGNILLGGIPESIGLLIFGIALVVVAIGLRWFLGGEVEQPNAGEAVKNLEQFDQANQELPAENLALESK